jgi:hypothetical protein
MKQIEAEVSGIKKAISGYFASQKNPKNQSRKKADN